MVNHAPSSAPGAFDVRGAPRLVYGCGVLQTIGKLARELGGQRVFVVTDHGLVATGHVARAEALLRQAGCTIARYDGCRENPTTRDVSACRDAAAAFGADLFVGLGGGSSIDTAKGANFLLTNGGEMKDYWGVGKATKPMLPLIAVPTTAGTGSEVQSFALIAEEGSHRKMACGDPKACPRIAVLDPELTLSLPRAVTAVTGLDTIGHAIEARVCRVGNALSSMYAREAWRLALPALSRVLTTAHDLDARGDLLLASAFAGHAIEASMLGAAHALANPLTAHFGVIHGQAVATMLPHVVRFNAGDAATAAAYGELAALVGLVAPGTEPAVASGVLAARLEALLEEAHLPPSLATLGVRATDLDRLAADAAEQWTAGFNPRAVDAEQLRSLYAGAL